MGAEEALRKNDESKAKVDSDNNVRCNDGYGVVWRFCSEER